VQVCTICSGVKRQDYSMSRNGRYGMFAFDGKEGTEGLGSIRAHSHPEDWQPPKTSRPIDPAKLTFVTSAL